MSSVLGVAGDVGVWILTVLVMLGAVPLLVSTYQSLLIGMHHFRNHYRAATPYLPRVAILVPAWNEAAVIGASVDRLMALDYPVDRLRVYVVDDASTDETPQVLAAKEREYDRRVLHLRREKGGEGKSHTLNHGLALIMDEPWMEALLITDADVIFERASLRRLTRHLGDSRVGAVTAYIKEGSARPNYLQRFVAYEYITAQAAARRSQNVLGAMACLAGGAQLHSRANLETLGGRIDTTSLAEDTFTTFETQLSGSRVVFDGNATVWAEEPDGVVGLWKQRLRWARGNVQVTQRYWHLWFRPSPAHRLGQHLLRPDLVQSLPAAGADARVLGVLGDALLRGQPARLRDVPAAVGGQRAVLPVRHRLRPVHRPRNGPQVLAPGHLVPRRVLGALHRLRPGARAADLPGAPRPRAPGPGRPQGTVHDGFLLFAYAWVALCMPVAYLGMVVEKHGRAWLSPLFVYIGGYGPLLCAVTFASYVKELRGADMTWDKTEKTGKIRITP